MRAKVFDPPYHVKVVVELFMLYTAAVAVIPDGAVYDEALVYT